MEHPYFTEEQLDEIEFEMQGPADLNEMEGVVEEGADFPIMMLQLALLKDFILDPATGGVTSYITTPIVGCIIALWMLNKGSFMQKMMRKWFWRRVLLWVAAELVPGVNALPIPLTTILVLSAHYRETRIIRELDEFIGIAYNNREATFGRLLQIAYASR